MTCLTRTSLGPLGIQTLSGRPAFEALDALEDEPLGRTEARGHLAEARRVGTQHGFVGMFDLPHRGVKLVDDPSRKERPERRIELEGVVDPGAAARCGGEADG